MKRYRTPIGRYLAGSLALTLSISGCTGSRTHFERTLPRLMREEHKWKHLSGDPDHYNHHYGVYPGEDPLYERRIERFRERAFGHIGHDPNYRK